MKVLYIVFYILSILFLQEKVHNYEVSLINNINKSIYKITITGLSGSGIIVKYNDQKYVLTNSHVCLGKYDKDYHLKDILLKEEDLIIENNNNYLYYKYDMNDMILDQNRDLCVIPIKGEVDYYDLNKENTLLNKMLFVFRENKVRMFTLNHNPMVYMKEGKYKYITTVKFKLDKTHDLRYDNSLITSLKVFYGDSGSPVFDKNYNLISLVFGTTILNQEGYKKASNENNMKKMMEYVKEGCILYPLDFKEFLLNI